jgi:adenylylsulfate kinase-like enzyme
VTIAAFVSPFEEERQQIKHIVGGHNYIEVYVSTTIDECERRDVKGLYKKARSGEIDNFTGISSPYEIPSKPDLTIDTKEVPLDEAVEAIFKILADKLHLQP